MVFLRQIDAHGFKSFADKVNIKFDSGVTAVVGPNGSGKSNITDAIRWVLGEQSARVMRGAKMEDIIFDGTENRTPMNYASVSLILNNDDRTLGESKEVVISRKLYRSGDSEYFINNEKSKLKDITELFLDSGLGKNAYNIISQGQVDEILKAKPVERRKIIEEAAGVMKYKNRKHESEKRLDETKQNLARVHDIIEEISSRVNRLERESAIAEEYLALKEEMTQSDIEVNVYDTMHLLTELDEINARIKKEETGLESARETLKEVLTALDSLEKERDTLQQEERTQNQTLLETTRELEKIEGRIALYAERETNKETLKQDLGNRLTAFEEELKTLTASLKQEEQKKNDMSAESSELAKTVKDKKRELNVVQLTDDSDIEKLKDEYYELMVKKTTLENDKRRSRDEQSKLADSIQYKNDRLTTLNEEITSLESTFKEKKEALSDAARKLTAARDDYKDVRLKLNELNAQYDKSKNDYNRAANFIQNQQSKLDMLKNMEENYQGYYPGVRAVLKNKDSIPGVIGAVGELISAPSEYMTALDTALGQASQNIVMDVEHNARTAIAFLKQKNFGFATFLPLDTIRERHLSVDVEKSLEASNIDYQILSEVADIKREYRKVLIHLVNTTVVVKNMSDASALARATGQRVRIITLDGETIMPGGAMSGGSRNRKGSIMESKKEIADITEKIEEYTSQTSALKKAVDDASEQIADATVELKQLEEAGSTLGESHDALQQEVTQLDFTLTNKTDAAAELKREVEALSPGEEAGGFDEKIEVYTHQMSDINTRIDMMSRSQSEKDEQIAQLQSELQQLNNDKITLDGEMRFTDAAIERISVNIDNVKHNIDNTKSEADMINDDLGAMDISELEENKARLSKSLEQVNSRLREITEQLTSIKENHKKNTEKEDELRKAADYSQQQLRTDSAAREGLDTQIENKITYLSDNYKMTYELARTQFEEFESIEAKRQKISLNKKSIEELGPVNIGAIEEFATVNERYTFLKEQEDDLIEARQTLLDVISEMDEAVAARFKETFCQVNHYFQEVFTDMFGGGRAELRLLDEGNYLDSGIEIFAEPPGKKLSSLSLLSGGERALTAISLLFSVLRVKVSPFIILDEVEAALDEANVTRYAKYLKKLSADTQFIVITHRKGTMEEADRLFGVTMQEKGVTKLISVDLKNYEEPEPVREDGN
ncbi:chromosome partition protein Smc [Jeotgalicoccus coquinae]|uniref:Chromosome partition protein Smc n=1 Tax=Jeotgalicoccus coquinae TaxID=709509 RepID=A0A6V7RKC4_9STAP|nr:chromosome segregation protein SMC [Jeotgalicoccus coquinae]MBB6422585.1 chromosome segregation protein [Jeotgalicoccus coquinae]GGE14713.1 chromosome partition protein Smc [Jeotgalicoccus coquinae]CAD2077952.1 Chromosome partition protein Smc [Jeotgalicoccus coquinae]